MIKMYHCVRSPLPGRRASRLISIAKTYCYDSTFTYPLVVANGAGCSITDVDGNSFLDFTSNIGSCPLGYSHPELLRILKEYSTNGVNKIAGQDFYCEEHIRLAKKLTGITPQESKVFFSNSGAEAVENALKIAYKSMGPLPGISCFNAFHGRTLGALTFTFSKPEQKANFPELQVKRIKFYTDDSEMDMDGIESVLKNNKVAFILTEIIQGEGGMNVANKKFISCLRRYADEYGIPLIVDEVQSGVGRTGKWWSYEHYDIKPDITISAKALQVGATIYKKTLDPMEKGVLSSTWGGGDRIDLALGAKIIDIIRREKLLNNARIMGEKIRRACHELVGKNGIIGIRGIGLMIGIEFDDKNRRDKKLLNLFKNGLLLLPAGKKSVRIMPPLVIEKEQVEEGISIIHKTLSTRT